MVIGSGPIVIGQSCEFDYSGTQACKALGEEGYRVILVNSNPATIMTDPSMAHRTYIEPLVPEIVYSILKRERPDALLPTMGGQTALNLTLELSRQGVFRELGTEIIGANEKAIAKAEDRLLFKAAMKKIGLKVPDSDYCGSVKGALKISEILGFPVVIRPAYTLGGIGGGIAMNREECERMVRWGLSQSPISRVLVEKSVMGWKEFELEVMRDQSDNVVVICSIENFDPMGVHTGDSVTVAPAQTLTDSEYQSMRDDAIAVIREIGVATGGSNIQFAVNPKTGERVVIEMNPRVSRSSALASKATGFPIAKIAARLAVGFDLEEIPNDITRETPSSFEPTLDYVVTKIPRFTFEKFPETDDALTTQMKSVGEVMAMGRTFKESFQKALRSLETGLAGFGGDPGQGAPWSARKLQGLLAKPNSQRLPALAEALARGWSVPKLFKLTAIDPWFLSHLEEIVGLQKKVARGGKRPMKVGLLRQAKSWGFSDIQLARLRGITETQVRNQRKRAGLRPTFRMVDTCGAEFEARTPYLYSSYSPEALSKKRIIEAPPSRNKKIIILGSGPTRIGQGIEFDYMCVHGAFALRERGFEVLMVNCNPETVSTDYDTSNRLFFEPLTLEDILEIYEREKPMGVIVQFGGQTPLKLCGPLAKLGVPILGTPPREIQRAEDRRLFEILLRKLGMNQAPAGIAKNIEEAKLIADKIGYPVLVRPSWVLGGRAMQIVYDERSLKRYMNDAVSISNDEPILVDKFLEGAIEVDADAIRDGKNCVVIGIMEHIEEAGIHSGDSACTLPPYSLSLEIQNKIRLMTIKLADALNVVGLINVQYAVKENEVYVIEANPRASRTVPFVSKVTGMPWAKVAARAMSGQSLKSQGITKSPTFTHWGVKEAVFPFTRFPEVDVTLGPEMKSTGEVMGIDRSFAAAFAKSQLAAGTILPSKGCVLVSVQDADKAAFIPLAQRLNRLGFKIVATEGTARSLKKAGIPCKGLRKVDKPSPNLLDWIQSGRIDLVLNVPKGKGSRPDGYEIRKAAVFRGIPYVTTVAGAKAAVLAIASMRRAKLTVKSLQEYHAAIKR